MTTRYKSKHHRPLNSLLPQGTLLWLVYFPVLFISHANLSLKIRIPLPAAKNLPQGLVPLGQGNCLHCLPQYHAYINLLKICSSLIRHVINKARVDLFHMKQIETTH